MTSKMELLFIYGLAAILLIIGVVCYASFPQEVPDEPVRLVFDTSAGKVLFDHQTHSSEDGYGFYCEDCHHYEQDDGGMGCGGPYCHGADTEPTRSDAFHANCQGCHEESGAGPVECGTCHLQY